MMRDQSSSAIVEGGSFFRDAGGRDEHVDATELAKADVAQPFKRSHVVHVGAPAKSAAPAGFDRGRHFVHERVTSAGCHDIGARIREAESDGATDAAGAADDDGNAAGEIEE